MNHELLRFSHVTTNEKIQSNLDDFNLSVLEGQIVGLIPINDTGLKTFLHLLQVNSSILRGKIFFKEMLVNAYFHSDSSKNNISIVDGNRLVSGLSVMDNIFLLSQGSGINNAFYSRKKFKIQLQWLLSELNIYTPLPRFCDSLTGEQRFIIELLRAIVRESKIIVLSNPSSFLTDREYRTVFAVIRLLKKKNYTFLYISNNYKQVCDIADKTVLIKDGTDIKAFWGREVPQNFDLRVMYDHPKGENSYTFQNNRKISSDLLLKVTHLYSDQLLDFSVDVHQGECVVVKANETVQDDLIAILLKDKKPLNGTIEFRGEDFLLSRKRDLYPTSLMLIKEHALKTMVYYDLNYMDNLTLGIDKKINGHYISHKMENHLREEMRNKLGDVVYTEDITNLSKEEFYTLIYNHVLLIKPHLVIIQRPFIEMDYNIRQFVTALIMELKNANISIVITSPNLVEHLSEADKIIEVHKKKVIHIYYPEDFSTIKKIM